MISPIPQARPSRHDFELADYEMKCDYRLAKGGTVVPSRTPFEPKDPTKDCYEFNMCDSHPAFPTGSVVGRKKADNIASGEDVWKSIHLTVLGNRIQAKIDGKDVIDFTDESDAKLAKGHIGLQMNGGKIEFRNVMIKPIVEPLFAGANLKGWRPVPGSKAKFDVEEGTIHATNGPGFLETEPKFDDFVLQFDGAHQQPGSERWTLLPGGAGNRSSSVQWIRTADEQ